MVQVCFLHVGQAGIQIGESFWDFAYKHYMKSLDNYADLNYDTNLEFYINEDQFSNEYHPRAILLDSEPIVIDQFHSNNPSLADKFDPISFISGKES